MPPARKREPIVPAKIRDVIEYMFTTSPTPTLQELAAHIGWPTRKLRFTLQQPHVTRFVLHEKQARLEVASAGNIAALLSIRDDRTNQMAAVHASKALESMLDATSERTGIGREVQQERRLPGLQIVILQPSGEQQVVCGPTPALIEATPAEVVPVSDSDDT